MRLQNCRKQEQAYAVLVMPLRSLSSQPSPLIRQTCLPTMLVPQTRSNCTWDESSTPTTLKTSYQSTSTSSEEWWVMWLSCDVLWCHMMSQDIYNTHSFFHTYSTICGHIHTDNFEIEPTCTVGLYWPGSSLTATNLVDTYMIDNHGSQRFWTDFEGRAWGQGWLL